MNLSKILNNKDVQSGKVGFRPKGDDSHYYTLINSPHGHVVQVHSDCGSFIGISPILEVLIGEWETFQPTPDK